MNPVTQSKPGGLHLNRFAAGLRLSPAEFDSAQGDPGWRYELINGVVVVNAAPMPQERGPNEMLGHWLLRFKEDHTNGSMLDYTLPEHDIHIGNNRRRADRVIWVGLGRQPRVDEAPSIAVEFVSSGKRNYLRDYETKRIEYASVNVQEYWIFNRFERTMTVFGSDGTEQIISQDEKYSSQILPGFELIPAKLFKIADDWESS